MQITLWFQSCVLYAALASGLQAATSQWSDLGNGLAGRAAVGTNPDGRLEVFARGADHGIWHASQTSAGAETWSAMETLGGGFISDPAVGADTDGRLEIFGVGLDHALWHNVQSSPGGAQWSGWTSLGGQGKDDPAVVQNIDGRLEVFIHTVDDSLWHTWQLTPGGDWAAGDEVVGDVTRAPALARNSDGRVIVFAGDTDGKFWWTIQNTAGADSWSPWWCLLGGTVNAPAAGANSDGRLQLFAVRPDGSVWAAAQTSSGVYTWTDWSPLRNATVVSGNVAVAANNDGRLEVFGRDANDTLIHAGQISPGAAWSSWDTLNGTLAADPASARNSDGRIEVFAVGAGGILRRIAQSSAGIWTPPPAGSVPPVISAFQPLENGASLAAGPVAPGSFVSVFGDNFGSGLTLANFGAMPLATALAGASVMFNGIPAALIGVASNQINAQVPWELLASGHPTGNAQVVVQTPAGASAAASVALTSSAPGVFSFFTDSTGVTRPAAYNNGDGTLPWPSNITLPGYQTRPIKQNETLILFATGLGAVTNQPADGAAGLAQPPYSTTIASPAVTIGGVKQEVVFSGLSPQYPSMYQIAVVIQPGTPAGDAVPIQIELNGITTTDQFKIAVSN